MSYPDVMTSPWLTQMKKRRWLGRAALLLVLLFVLMFTFLVSFPMLGFGNTHPNIIIANIIAALISATFFGERLRVNIERRGGASFLWLGPMYAGFAAIAMGALGMFLYWVSQQFESEPRDGNPWFGGVLLVMLYLPIAMISGVVGGFLVWRRARLERVF
jgi:hypothetical protein